MVSWAQHSRGRGLWNFQKRGLPHARILLILTPYSKVQVASNVDAFVSAELPDESSPAQERLAATVRKCMTHEPCGPRNPNAPCCADGPCKKGFPKSFVEATQSGADAYTLYRRRDNGRHFLKQGVRLDNRDTVPYNPWLCAKYDCHINVEHCASIRSVKYLCSFRICQ